MVRLASTSGVVLFWFIAHPTTVFPARRSMLILGLAKAAPFLSSEW
jgi:hypothetical protein